MTAEDNFNISRIDQKDEQPWSNPQFNHSSELVDFLSIWFLSEDYLDTEMDSLMNFAVLAQLLFLLNAQFSKVAVKNADNPKALNVMHGYAH
ncbi:hypothetical protein HUJ05_001319 [Dendroctonus ponderosae]|nr:hypothetical protein HUJ05_001319 [Dendroctonus ponderosae]